MRCRHSPSAAAALVLTALASTALATPAHADAPAPTGRADAATGAPRLPARVNGLVFGAVLSTNSAAWEPVLHRSDVRGALVLAVIPSSPAATAHIEAGDIVVAIDNEQIGGADRAGVILRTTQEANHTFVLVAPDGTSRSVGVQLHESAPVSLPTYLKKALAEDTTPLTEYLAAQLSQDQEAAPKFISLLTQGAPLFAGGHLLAAQTALNASLTSKDKGGLSPDSAAAIQASVDRAIALGGDSAEVLAASVPILLVLNEPERALATAMQAVALDPGSAKASFAAGTAQLRVGNPAAAIPGLRRAVDLDPYNPAFYAPLARAYQAAGQGEAAKATQATAAALATITTSAGSASKARQVAVALAAVIALSALVLTLFGGWRAPDHVAPGVTPAQPRSLAPLVEATAALGAWSIAIPWLGAAFGYAPESVLRLEIADHVLPGLFVLAVAVWCLPRLVDGALDDWPALPLASALMLLAGLWMAAAHVPLLLQAFQHRRSWNLALLHSSAGLGIVGLAVILCRRAWYAEHVAPARPTVRPVGTA